MAIGSVRSRALPIAALAFVLLGAGSQEPYGLPLKGEEAEAFLSAAEVVKKKGLPVGITRSYQLTLTDGTRTHKAAWKVIDEYKSGVTRFQEGGFEVDFRDSYKYEIAVYELDKLLGLDLVPPTVERVIDGERGSLQMWVEGCMTEADRKQRKIKVPSSEPWNRQMYKVRLLHQLTYNTDHANIRNVLIDPEFRIYAIDFSRSFRTHRELMGEKDLDRFSRATLDRLRTLDKTLLADKLGRWLRQPEIDALLARRDAILGLVERRIAERGEGRVLY
jgi:hypothetical protein